MSFYSLSSYSQLRVNQSAIGGTPTPNPFSNTKSILLDGIDAYVDCGTNLALLGSATTFSAWVKMTDATSFRVLHKGIAGSREYAFGMGTSDTLFLILYNGSTNYIGKVSTSTMTSYQGQWVHICATYDGSTNASGIVLYVNGSVFNSNSISGGSYTAPSGNNNGDVYIGRYNTEYADGNLDEVSVFNTELSQSDVTSIYNSGVPNDISSLSPLSWWRFEGSGTTAIDSGSGGNNGTLENTVVRSTDVPPNPFVNTLSTYFDGIDDRVEINRTLTNGYAELSVSTWVKYNNNVATSNQYHPIVARQGSLGNSFALQNMRSGASSNGGELYFGVQTPNGSFTAFSGVVPSQNVWYNIVGTYDGSNVKIYIDGVLKGTLSASGNINTNNTVLYLGDSGYGGYSQILNGNLDEVSIYSRGLTQSEVTDIFGQGVPSDVSSISDIVAYWRMGDGDTANTITDNVGSNNGTMVNMNASNFVTDVPT